MTDETIYNCSYYAKYDKFVNIPSGETVGSLCNLGPVCVKVVLGQTCGGNFVAKDILEAKKKVIDIFYSMPEEYRFYDIKIILQDNLYDIDGNIVQPVSNLVF